MLELRLTDKETEALHKIRETYLSDLREKLKSEEMFIKELLRRLENAGTHVVASVERIDDDVHS